MVESGIHNAEVNTSANEENLSELERRCKENHSEFLIASALSAGFGVIQGYCLVKNYDPSLVIHALSVVPFGLHIKNVYDQFTLIEEVGKDSGFEYPSNKVKKRMSVGTGFGFYGAAFSVGAVIGMGAGYLTQDK